MVTYLCITQQHSTPATNANTRNIAETTPTPTQWTSLAGEDKVVKGGGEVVTVSMGLVVGVVTSTSGEGVGFIDLVEDEDESSELMAEDESFGLMVEDESSELVGKDESTGLMVEDEIDSEVETTGVVMRSLAVMFDVDNVDVGMVDNTMLTELVGIGARTKELVDMLDGKSIVVELGHSTLLLSPDPRSADVQAGKVQMRSEP